MNTYDLTLDLSKRGPFQSVPIRQGDKSGTTIRATITDHGVAVDTNGLTARFVMRLPDNEHYYREPATLSGSTATVTIDEAQAASATGRTDVAYFQLLQGADVIASTESITVIVLPDALADATVPESYDTEIQRAIDNANDAAEEAREAASGIPITVSSRDVDVLAAESTGVLSGTTTIDKAWSLDGTTTSGTNYHYVTYALDDAYRTLVIDGASYGANFPLVAFLDSNNTVVSEVHSSSFRLYNEYPVDVPDDAVTAIVNGYKTNVVYTLGVAYGTKSQLDENASLKQSIQGVIESVRTVDVSRVVVDGLDSISGTHTSSKAWNVTGTPTTGNNYEYGNFDLSGIVGDTVFVSGCSWGNQWPLVCFYDENGNLISTYGVTGNKDWVSEEVTVPSGASYCIVNGGTQASRPTSAVWASVVVETQADVNDRVSQALSVLGVGRKYLFIGDSYAQGYSHDGSNSGWPVYMADFMGLASNDYVVARNGGAGFVDQNNSFISLLRAHPNESFTDIVVCGGFNDNSQNAQSIESAINAFIVEAASMYPSARVYVGCIGYIKQGSGESAYENWEEVRGRIEGTVVPAYKTAIRHGARYLNNSEFLLGDSGLTPTDGYHPSEDGNRAIAAGIANALLTGSAPLPYNHDMRAQ